jgi:hypothetical protein
VVTRGKTGDCTPGGTPSANAAKRHVVANVAIGRELAGRCWSLAMLEE